MQLPPGESPLIQMTKFAVVMGVFEVTLEFL